MDSQVDGKPADGRPPRSNHLTDEGMLRMVAWARPGPRGSGIQQIDVDLGPRSIKLNHAPATGEGLVGNGRLGVDLIRVAAGEGFQPHTHPGDHILIVVGGEGTITHDGTVYPTQPGDVYMVEGGVPHAVGARSDHVILAVGSPHKAVDDVDRMTPAEYREILSPLGDLRCLICQRTSTHPRLLHNVDCEHCPCPACSRGISHHAVE